MSDTRKKNRYIRRLEDIEGYCPENHGGTTNFRIIGAETVDARNIELSIGEIEPGGFAEYHAHPVEQVVHVIEGELEGFIDGEPATLVAGDWLFIPSGVFHGVRAKTHTRLIVIYTPPLTEHRDKIEVRPMPGAQD